MTIWTGRPSSAKAVPTIVFVTISTSTSSRPGREIHILAETVDESIIRTLLLHNKAINIGYDYADPLYPHPDIVSRTLKEEISGQMIYLVSNLQVRKTKAACLCHDYLLEWMKKKAAIR